MIFSQSLKRPGFEIQIRVFYYLAELWMKLWITKHSSIGARSACRTSSLKDRICSTTERGWQKKAAQGSMIICDSLTAQKLRNDDRVRIFPLVSQASIDRLMD
jgi:hypothetical protein